MESGRLAVFESTVEGDFTVYPNASDCFAKDTNHKILYFASPKSGDYMLIFFGIRDGAVLPTADGYYRTVKMVRVALLTLA